jgi:hypothetical protein
LSPINPNLLLKREYLLFLKRGKARRARKADNLTAICEPIVKTMGDLRRLTTLWAFTVGYRQSFTFFIPVTGRVGLQGCEKSRLSHFLENRLTSGGETVILTRQPRFNNRKILDTHISYLISEWTSGL